MTKKNPKLVVRVRKRKSGKVTTYYYYDRRADGMPDEPLGSDHETALAKWHEIHNNAPRIAGTLEEAFGRWEAEMLPTYENQETKRGYSKSLKKLRPVFGQATWESIELRHLKTYLSKRTAKTQGNRELSLLSIIWNWSRTEGLTNMPWPAAGMEKVKWKNRERARRFEVTDEMFAWVYAEGDQVLKDCMDVATSTGLRLTDVRTIPLPPGDLLRLTANKTGKDADFDMSLSAVLSDLVTRRRAMRATHGMLISTPTGRAVSASMLRDRYEAARSKAALKAEAENRPALATAILSMFMRDMRKRAADLAEDLEGAAKLLQHGSTKTTQKHYRTKATQLKPVR